MKDKVPTYHTTFTLFINSKAYWFITRLILVILSNQPLAVQTIKCSQCSTVQDSLCITQPPRAIECPNLIFQFCLTVVESNLSGTLLSYTRSCSPDFYASKCENIDTAALQDVSPPLESKHNSTTRRLQQPSISFIPATVNVCVKTCAQDGCNSKPALILSDPTRPNQKSSSGPIHTEPGFGFVFVVALQIVVSFYTCFMRFT